MKENKFNVSSKTVPGGLMGQFELDTGEGLYQQDLSKFVRDAELERRRQEQVGFTPGGHRKFATIPDGVALKILEEHGLDIHDPTFMADADKVKKFKDIMIKEYRYLVVNT